MSTPLQVIITRVVSGAGCCRVETSRPDAERTMEKQHHEQRNRNERKNQREQSERKQHSLTHSRGRTHAHARARGTSADRTVHPDRRAGHQLREEHPRLQRRARLQDDPDTRKKRIDRAKHLVMRKAPECLETFWLIIRNGKNRKESIWQLMKGKASK